MDWPTRGIRSTQCSSITTGMVGWTCSYSTISPPGGSAIMIPGAIDRRRPVFEGGDRLYRNDGGRFTEVTAAAGMFSSEAGFGLGASAGDLNRDGCMDLYVSNDFFERDYLYVNRCDGTFEEVLEETLASIRHDLDGWGRC